MAHYATHCDVIDCPDCRRADREARDAEDLREQEAIVTDSVNDFDDWLAEIDYDRDGDAAITLSLTVEEPDDTLALTVAGRLMRAAEEIRRRAYLRQGAKYGVAG